jgi:tight adherence protein C
MVMSISILVFLLVLLLLLPGEFFRSSYLKKMKVTSISEVELNTRGNQLMKRMTRSFSSLLIRYNIQLSLKKREKYNDALIQAGLREKWSPMDIISGKILLPFIIFFSYLFLALINNETLFYIFSFTLPFIAYFIPDYWLATQVKRRKDTIRKELPHYVNGIAVMCEADY